MKTLRFLIPAALVLASIGGCASPSTEEPNEAVESAASASTKPMLCASHSPLGTRRTTLFTNPDRDPAVSAVVVRVENLPEEAGSLTIDATRTQTQDITFWGTTDIARVKRILEKRRDIWNSLPTDWPLEDWLAQLSCKPGKPPAPVTTTSEPACSFDHESGAENPLGMRADLTIAHGKGKRTVDVKVEIYPSNLEESDGLSITSETATVLSINGSIESARKWLADSDTTLAASLFDSIEYEASAKEYAEADAALTCK